MFLFLWLLFQVVGAGTGNLYDQVSALPAHAYFGTCHILPVVCLTILVSIVMKSRGFLCGTRIVLRRSIVFLRASSNIVCLMTKQLSFSAHGASSMLRDAP